MEPGHERNDIAEDLSLSKDLLDFCFGEAKGKTTDLKNRASSAPASTQLRGLAIRGHALMVDGARRLPLVAAVAAKK